MQQMTRIIIPTIENRKIIANIEMLGEIFQIAEEPVMGIIHSSKRGS